MKPYVRNFLGKIDIVLVARRLLPENYHHETKKGLWFVCFSHTERSPSFFVYRQSQQCHCFGCGLQGNALELVMEYLRMDAPSAMKWLSDTFGVPLPVSKTHPKKARTRNRKYTQAKKKKRASITKKKKLGHPS
jgi:DNA primase